ncbi:hypothetical protein [Salinibacterium sp. ZJ77]|uniref:hypothetical protein n=1 Tax=Salinibacterium sp. ZJ77 TaxID=2708337 RepID=UPI001422B0B0|nr:hypothetical protein [Salinibacterium sp. ZJ77]
MTTTDDVSDSADTVPGPESVIVEIAPGAALVYGKVPDGLDFIPSRLFTVSDQALIGSALAKAGSTLNLGGQVANSLLHTQPGLYQLSAQTIAKMQETGATLLAANDGGGLLGTLTAGARNNWVGNARFVPASGLHAAGVIAAIGPAIAMIAIQVQLNELHGLQTQNLELTEGVLKTVRHEQWAELTGLDRAVAKALDEASIVGEVTPLIWQNIHGSEKDLQKHRDLYRLNVENHAEEIARRTGHVERRQYVEKHGEAMLLDLHSLVLAHKAWFEYQALRAGRARLEADVNPSEAKLLDKITSDASAEYHAVGNQMADLLQTLTRELSILAELPGKRTIPIGKTRRAADEVAGMATQLLNAARRIGAGAYRIPGPLDPPQILYVQDDDRVADYLRILRWHISADEHVLAFATGRRSVVGTIESLGDGIERGANAIGSAVGATFRRLDILEAAADGRNRDDLLIAITSERVLIADVAEFRSHGVIGHAVPAAHIRYVRWRNGDARSLAEVDLITKDTDFYWRFGRGSAGEDAVKHIVALLADRMHIPGNERDSLVAGRSTEEHALRAISG